MKRRLAAVCFADIVGYTELSSRDEGLALSLVQLLQEISGQKITEREGRVVKHLGDAILAEFQSVEAAVEAALAIAGAFEGRSDGHRLRVAVHLGETTVAPDGDVYGDVVNVASRLQGEAEPGQVLVSGDVHRQLERRLAFDFSDAGARSLKGLSAPLATYAVKHRYRPSAADASPASPGAGAVRRLAVLPFRMLRPDPAVDFLPFALSDAIATSLVGLPTLVVRATSSVQKYAGISDDPVAVAKEAGVDLLLTGTILSSGERLRVATQLIDGSLGTLLWSDSSTVSVEDMFSLQDDLSRRVLGSLANAADAPEPQGIDRDVPRSGAAYQLFLRGNQLSSQYGNWRGALDLYQGALAEDAEYAPTWAQLGRCQRLIAKYSVDPAETAQQLEAAEASFQKALELSPDLPLAHSFYAQFEVETGRCVDGMVRLLGRLKAAGPAVQLYVGLTHACRYAGLMSASFAGHARATELDPRAATSVAYSHLALGENESALEASVPGDFASTHAKLLLGRGQEALDEMARTYFPQGSGLSRFADSMRAVADGDVARALEVGRFLRENLPDPEASYVVAAHWARLGSRAEAMELLSSTVHRGYYCVEGLEKNPVWKELREEPEFGAILERADAGREAAVMAFEAEGGPALLGTA